MDRRARILLLMCAGMFLVLLDVTVVNVALPAIGTDLDTGVATLQWVVDGYAVAIASLLLAGGTVGDRFGHTRTTIAGFGVFAVASAICASAPSAGVLVAGRVLEGIGGAVLLPSTMAVIAETYPEPGEQARAIGTWAAASSLALPAGPLVGGLLVDTVGWRWVFWLNLPVVAVVLAATAVLAPRRPGRRSGPFDAAGLAGFVLALAAAVFAVIAAGHGSGTVEVAVVAAFAVVALAAAVRAERRAPRPVLPLDLLRDRRFRAPNLVALVMNLTFNGLLFVTTLYLQDVRGYRPLLAGCAVLPITVPLVVLAPLSGRWAARSGPRVVVSTGCLFGVIGVLPILTVTQSSAIGLLVGLGVLGCAAGLVTASVVAAVVRATPAERPGLATGMSNTARQIGTAAGVAVFGAVAGPPGDVEQFIARLHVLALVAAALWLAAGVAARGIAGFEEPTPVAGRD